MRLKQEAKEEALRIKKKYESDINEMEIALVCQQGSRPRRQSSVTNMQLGDVLCIEEEEED